MKHPMRAVLAFVLVCALTPYMFVTGVFYDPVGWAYEQLGRFLDWLTPSSPLGRPASQPQYPNQGPSQPAYDPNTGLVPDGAGD